MRILLATDGSEDAQRAVQWLQSLPVPADSRYRVVAVVTYPPSPLDIPTVREYNRRLRDGARTVVERAAQALAGRPVETRVLEGEPRERIVAAACDWPADLVVVGAKGLGAIKRFLLGSVSTGIVHGARCAVAVVRGEVRPPGRVVIASDGSKDAQAAVRFVASLPFAPSASFTLLAAVPPLPAVPVASDLVGTPWPPAPEIVAQASAEMQRTLGEVEAHLGRPAKRTVVVGDPASEIVSAAHEADLVVLGARGLGPVGRLVMGSVSERVLQHAPCPVLVVKGAA